MVMRRRSGLVGSSLRGSAIAAAMVAPPAVASSVALARPDSPHCCLACRLVQPRTNVCAHCGAAVVARIELLQEMLGYPDLRLEGERDLGLVTALLAGGSLALPFLLPIAALSLGVLLARAPLRRRRARARANHEMASVVVPPAVVGHGCEQVIGAAHGCGEGRVRALLGGEPCLATAVTVATSGGVLLRATRTTAFVVHPTYGRPVVVTGEIRLIDRGPPQRVVEPGDPLLTRLRIPDDLRIHGHVDEVAVVDGTPVVVWGRPTDEAVGELAFHRDGGVVRVMRGEPGAPVLVSASMVALR